MAHTKVHKVLSEFKRSELRSGSGAKVTSRDQAVVIGLSEARKAGEDVPQHKSPPSGVQAFTTTTDLPRPTELTTASPKAAPTGNAGLSPSNPAGVREYDRFLGHRASNVQKKGGKSPSPIGNAGVSAKLPADVDQNFRRLP